MTPCMVILELILHQKQKYKGLYNSQANKEKNNERRTSPQV